MLSHQGVLHQTRSQTYNLIKFFEEKNTLQYDPRMRKSQFSMKILLTFHFDGKQQKLCVGF